jgi:hypothetical protein
MKGLTSWVEIDAALRDAVEGGLRVPWQYSYLGIGRRRLWSALGEENETAYILPGKAETELGKEDEATSEKLAFLLGLMWNEWEDVAWVHLHRAKDPRKDAVSSGGWRNRLPIISRIFSDESEAKAYAEELIGNDLSSTPAPSTTTGMDLPPYPDAWDDEEFRSAWIDELANAKKELGPGLPRGPQMVKLCKNLTCDAENVEAWWEHV